MSQTRSEQSKLSRPGSRFPVGSAPKGQESRMVASRIWGYLRSRWKTIAAVFALSLATTVITIVGTRLTGYAVDAYITQGDLQGLAEICLTLLAIYLIGVVGTYLQNTLMIKTAQRAAADIRKDLFASMQALPLRYYDTHSSGDLMSRLTNDVDNINTALSQNMVQFFTSIIMIVGMLLAMIILSPFLTLICLVTLPLTVITSRVILRLAQRFYGIQQRELGEMNGYIEEMISGQKVVRLFGHEKMVQASFDNTNTRFAISNFKAICMSNLVGPLNNFVNILAYIAVSAAGGAAIINGSGGITVGVILSFLMYMRNFTMPINNILILINTLQLASASAERVFELMDEKEEADSPGAAAIEGIRGDIDMDIQSFSYVPEKNVLRGAKISAQTGQTVAIVGPTGSGKTTIINLLTRFYDLDEGTILIDGKDARTLTLSSLRRSIAVVLQDTFLFSDSIRENIRYGRPAATDQDVEEAAKKARAHEFICSLPHGYDTILVDNGRNISQGQRQLLGIARAIASDASVLILDEATSSIDTRTEMLIQQALTELTRGKTTFIIAHRLSTIKNANKILVINNGQVVESGTHTELMAKRGFYEELYTAQFKGFAI